MKRSAVELPETKRVKARKSKSRPPVAEQASILNLLWDRPGFLIRRLHQIHSAMFLDQCRDFNITPVQYSLLSVVRVRPGLDQRTLAEELGIDRSNSADVIARLTRLGLIRSLQGEEDRRTKTSYLTEKGQALLTKLDPLALAAHDALIADLSPARRRLFIRLLQQLVISKNELGRAPLKLL